MRRNPSLVFALLYLLALTPLSAQQTASAPPAAAAAPKPGPVAGKEDWTALPLDKSGLDPRRIMVTRISLWEKEDYTEELLRAQWRSNDPIDLYVVRPKGTAKVRPILYLYDYSNDADRFRNESWCKRVTAGGFAAVGFVSAVSMDRMHAPRPFKAWFFSELPEGLGASVHDVQMILNYLDQRGDIDVSHVGMFGQGSGASIAVLAAAVDPRLTTLDLYDLWGDWPDWLAHSPVIPQEDRAKYTTPEYLGKVQALDPKLYLPRLHTPNVRIEYILEDQTTPERARDALLEAAPLGTDKVRYKDEAAHQDEYHLNGLSGWIKTKLASSNTPQGSAALQAPAARTPAVADAER